MTKPSVATLLKNRKTVRAFRPDPVARELVEELVISARTAPSGGNLQPGGFHMLAGDILKDFTAKIIDAIDKDRPQVSQYSYFPRPMPDHLKALQRETGFGLYKTLGIDKRDKLARKEAFKRNYHFFDAPIGIVITIDKRMGSGGFMDLGMMLMAFMLAAKDHGLATCPLGSIGNYGDLVHEILELAEDELVVCGMALGYEDTEAVVNGFRTTRKPLETFATFRGFAD